MILNGTGRLAMLFLIAMLLPLLFFSQQINAQEVTSKANSDVTEILEVKADFSSALLALKQRSLSKRAEAIKQLIKIENPRTIIILDALLIGNLFENRADGSLLIAENQGDYYAASQAETGDSIGRLKKADIKKIRLSNRLRSQLRLLLAQKELYLEDTDIRMQAVKTLAKNPTKEAIQLLKSVADSEQDETIQQEIQLILALQDMTSSDKNVRLAAVESLKQHTSLEAVNRLQHMLEKDSDGQFNEPDKQIRKIAKSALVKIEARLQVYATIKTVFFGLSLGAVLVLAAIGLAITFGVMGVINMAHGEMMMLGAYTTYVMQLIMPNHIALSLILSIPAAFIVAGLVGIAIERGIIRFLYGRPLETLLATFGVSLFLQQTVRSIFSPLNRSVITPDFMSGSLYINDFLSFTWNRIYILVFCLLVFAALLQILRRTRLGLEVRAVSQNRNMAKAMGIPTDKVDAMTFGLGSGVAGIAGVALSQITNVGPNLGQAYIVDSFMVVVFGGVGNLWGTLVSGFTLGIANKVLEPIAGAVLAKVVVLVFIILFIQKRPRGLFPQKGRAAES